MVDVSKFGKKHCCFQCGTKFYDMNKAVPVCPKCGSDQTGKATKPQPLVITDEDLDSTEGRVYDDDRSLPGDLDMEVGSLDGEDAEALPEMEEMEEVEEVEEVEEDLVYKEVEGEE